MTSSSGRQPNFAALNRGRHLYSAGRPSRWALAHISSVFLFLSTIGVHSSFYNISQDNKNAADTEFDICGHVCACVCARVCWPMFPCHSFIFLPHASKPKVLFSAPSVTFSFFVRASNISGTAERIGANSHWTFGPSFR